jgi:hypothetical protein
MSEKSKQMSRNAVRVILSSATLLFGTSLAQTQPTYISFEVKLLEQSK